MASILIAEDSVTEAVHIQGLLESAGYEVLVSRDGEQAIEMLNEQLPDLILTDLNMPEMDGLELVAYVREHHSTIPVVLMTADGSEDTAVLALKKGAASYLPKRHQAKSLISTVEEILELLESCRTQNEVAEALVAVESTYEVGNDHHFASQVIGVLEEQLHTMKYGDATGMLRITMALREAVTNAIDHGNLGLDSAMRNEDGPGYSEQGRQRAKQQPWMHRRVSIRCRVTQDEASYTVTDQGDGFDPSMLPDPLDPENLLRAHGRGLMLIRSFMDEVSHNQTGNAITMVKRRDSLETAAVSDSESAALGD